MTGRSEPQLREQAPFVWLANVGLPALGWLFLVAAGIVVAADVPPLAVVAGDPATLLVSLLALVARTAIVLAPAALLWRVRDAHRRLPLLLAGLALVASMPALRALAEVLRIGADDVHAVATIGLYASVAGSALVGIGLLRLRARGATRPLVLGLIAGAYLAELAMSIATSDAAADGAPLALPIAGALVLAFASWVPVSAWLDSDAPRRFWALLALAAACLLVRLALGVAMLGAPDHVAAAGQPLVGLAASVLTAAAAIAALIAYGRYAPGRDS